jgi:hypothetical protein
MRRTKPLTAAQQQKIATLAHAGLRHKTIARKVKASPFVVLNFMVHHGLQRISLDAKPHANARQGLARRGYIRVTDEQITAMAKVEPPLSMSEIARRLGFSKRSLQMRLQRRLPELWLEIHDRFPGGRPRIELPEHEQTCGAPGCDRPVAIKKLRLCTMHAQRWYRERREAEGASAPAAAAVAAAPRPG